MEMAQSDASAYMDWYRIETERAYLRPEDEVTGNPSDDYVRRPAGLAGMWEGVRYQAYEASDGHVLFMASEQAFWKNFCECVGRTDLFERWPGSKRCATRSTKSTTIHVSAVSPLERKHGLSNSSPRSASSAATDFICRSLVPEPSTM